MVSNQTLKDDKGRVWLTNLRDCTMESQTSLLRVGAGNNPDSMGSPTPGLQRGVPGCVPVGHITYKHMDRGSLWQGCQGWTPSVFHTRSGRTRGWSQY